MWVFPLAAALVAAAFAFVLGRRFVQRRRSYEGFWAVALLMYAGASRAGVLWANPLKYTRGERG